jgi:hypothetical protein
LDFDDSLGIHFAPIPQIYIKLGKYARSGHARWRKPPPAVPWQPLKKPWTSPLREFLALGAERRATCGMAAFSGFLGISLAHFYLDNDAAK